MAGSHAVRSEGGEFTKSWYTSMHTIVRNGNRYAYRSTWVDGRCKKTYVGTGVKAAEAARKEASDRIQESREQQLWLLAWAKVEAASRPLDALCAQARLLTHAVMAISGCYLHRGHEWRRRGKDHG